MSKTQDKSGKTITPACSINLFEPEQVDNVIAGEQPIAVPAATPEPSRNSPPVEQHRQTRLFKGVRPHDGP